MPGLTIAVLGSIVFAAVASVAPPDDGPWNLPGPGAALTGVVRFEGGGCEVEGAPKASAMALRVRGTAAVLDGRTLRQLAATAQIKQPRASPDRADTVLLWRVTVCPGPPATAHTVELRQAHDGGVWVMSGVAGGTNEAAAARLLDPDKLEPLINDWPTYAGDFASTPAPADPFPLSAPYYCSRTVLNKPTLGDRFLRGRTTSIDAADRLLKLEKMIVRLPAGYTPRTPAGLLVWIDAGDDGTPPACLHGALDAANVVAIGIANCGNTRPIANRYQLSLDAVATAGRRYHLDPRRVYISGISGGGRVSSILAACFPDVFTGCIPIVGMSCYELVATPHRRYAPVFAKPPARLMALLRTRRIAPITGGRDFNGPEITAAAQALRGDGLQVRVFELVGMGHELPKPELFAEAFTWVDEPYQRLRRAEIEAAEREIKAARAKPDDRGAALKVTQAGPWTLAAWAALDRAPLDRAAP
jgi:predicted esterase